MRVARVSTTRRRRRVLAHTGAISIAIGLCVLPPRAAVAASLTLADAVTQALHAGPDARIARLEVGQAADALAEARSIYWPHATVSSQAGYSDRQDEKLRAIDRNGEERVYGLASLGSDNGWFNFYIDQLLFDLSRWRHVERAELSAEAARIAEDEQREAISLAVLQRYADVLRLARLIELDDGRLARALVLDARAASLLEAGRVLAADRDQVAVVVDELRMEAEARRDALGDARRLLAAGIGGDPAVDADALVLSEEGLPAPRVAGDPAADEALAGAPELRVLALRQRMEETAVAVARAGRYPTVGLRAGYSNYGAKRFDNFTDEMRIGVDVRIPLFDGLQTRHAVAGALKGAEIARLRYESVREAKRARVRDLSRRLAATARAPELARRRAANARERLRLATLRLEAERGSLAEALAAAVDAGREARAAVDAGFDRLVLWGTLQREIGRLSAAILGAGDPASSEGSS